MYRKGIAARLSALKPRKLAAVVTSIQAPTRAIRELALHTGKAAATVYVIGDRKGPSDFQLEGSRFYSLEQQQQLSLNLAGQLPVGHYARKNLGFLLAMADGAQSIYETDDDNQPLPGWQARNQKVEVFISAKSRWVNIYRYFSSAHLWPRGFPLDEIARTPGGPAYTGSDMQLTKAPIQQGLANGSPDVDAIWRLAMDQEVEFAKGASILVPPGSWCPFNSQSTWWWPEAYPLMYLPSFCSFRMTDIWRSFVAQRCLWELGYGLVFHAPEVFQERNEHDLMRDFADEVEGYLRNKELVEILSDLSLIPGRGHQAENLLTCYSALVSHDFFPEKELELVKAWLADLERMGFGD